MKKPNGGIFGRVQLKYKDDHETPVMVYGIRDEVEGRSATYEDVVETGTLDGVELNRVELDWLRAFRALADAWFNYCRGI